MQNTTRQTRGSRSMRAVAMLLAVPALVTALLATELTSCGLGQVSDHTERSIRACQRRSDCFDDEHCQAGLCIVLPAAECGNRQLEWPEECDLGEANSNEDYCTLECKENVCGDGHCWPEREECDDGNTEDQDACKNDCTENVCGDGVIHFGIEACDSGMRYGSLTCDEYCRPILCGNGEVDEDMYEQCDHGEDNHPNGRCLPNCLYSRCGDGWVDLSQSSTEECDERDTGNVETGECTPGCKLARCGDGMVWEGKEGCDDGNTEDGDGCSEECVIETGYCCIEPGEACVAAGTEHPTEQCLYCFAENGTSWSPKDTSQDCNDGNPCTVDDKCNGAGSCAPGGTPYVCAEIECLVGECKPERSADDPCEYTVAPDGNTCNDQVFCNGSDACAGGECREHAGYPCSGGTPYCDEAGSQCAACLEPSHCGTSTDPCITRVCTEAHVCADRGCSGTTPHCRSGEGCVGCLLPEHCDDGIACTANTCVSYSCHYPSNCGSEFCDRDSGECVECRNRSDCPANEFCVNGHCQQ